MGAASVTGTGPGSAENQYRGLSLENINKVLNTTDKASVADFFDGKFFIPETLLGPKIKYIDRENLKILFDVEGDYQIEIYKYIKKLRGPHIRKTDLKVYDPGHIGKRYKPYLTLAKGAKEWNLKPTIFGSTVKYFRFGYTEFFPDGRLKRRFLPVETGVKAWLRPEHTTGILIPVIRIF